MRYRSLAARVLGRAAERYGTNGSTPPRRPTVVPTQSGRGREECQPEGRGHAVRLASLPPSCAALLAVTTPTLLALQRRGVAGRGWEGREGSHCREQRMDTGRPAVCVCVCACEPADFSVSAPSLPPSRRPSFLGAGGCFHLQGLEESGRGRLRRPSPCPSSKGRQPLTDLWLRRQTTCLRQCPHSFCHTAVLSVAVVAHFTISLCPQLPRKEDLSLTGPAPAQTILFLTPRPGVRHRVGAVLALPGLSVRSSLAGDSKGSPSSAGWEYAKD